MPIATRASQLLVNTSLSRLMQDKLAQLSPLDNATLTDNIWRFQHPAQTITIDFTLFEQPFVQFVEMVTVRFDAQHIPLSLVEFAKLIWLEVASGVKVQPRPYYQIIDKLAMLFHYLHAEQIDQLDALNLEGFYGLCLTQNVTNDGIKKRLSAPAYTNRFEPLTLKKLKQILNRYGVAGLVGDISEKKAILALNEACLSFMGMTRREYVKGGSFNYLGLDVGKHYIDHCLHLFEKHCAYISAIRHTCKALFDTQQHDEDLKFQKKSTSLILGKVICGHSIEAIRESFGNRSVAEKKLVAIESFVHQMFSEVYITAERIVNAFKLDTINRIAKHCHLPERYDAQEFVRALLFVDVFGEHGKSKEAIWEEYQATLYKTALPDEDAVLSVTLPEFESITADILSELKTEMPTDTKGMRAFLKSLAGSLPTPIDEHPLNGMEYLNKMTSMIEDAGVTGFVGLTDGAPVSMGLACRISILRLTQTRWITSRRLGDSMYAGKYQRPVVIPRYQEKLRSVVTYWQRN